MLITVTCNRVSLHSLPCGVRILVPVHSHILCANQSPSWVYWTCKNYLKDPAVTFLEKCREIVYIASCLPFRLHAEKAHPRTDIVRLARRYFLYSSMLWTGGNLYHFEPFSSAFLHCLIPFLPAWTVNVYISHSLLSSAYYCFIAYSEWNVLTVHRNGYIEFHGCEFLTWAHLVGFKSESDQININSFPTASAFEQAAISVKQDRHPPGYKCYAVYWILLTAVRR